MSVWWKNLQPVTGADPGNRAMNYGDGVFATLYVDTGRPECLAWHLERLELGAMRLAMSVPASRDLERAIKQYCDQEFSTQSGILKVLLIRAETQRGYGYSQPATADLWLGGWPGSLARSSVAQPIHVTLSKVRLARQTQLAGMKHLNRLEQVLSAGSCPYDEVIQLDTKGHVVSASAGNLFLIRGDRLVTPGLSHAGISGVIRRLVLTGAEALGLVPEVRDVEVAELRQADEAFITNSRFLLRPIKRLESHRYNSTAEGQRVFEMLKKAVATQ